MPRHLMLFDLYGGGHHHQYIRQVTDYWVRHGLAGRLSVVVPASFLAAHPTLAPYAAAHAGAGLQVVPITEPVRLHNDPRHLGLRPLLQNDREHGRLLRRYVARLGADHAVLMYFDHAQFSLAFGLRFARPVGLSGIYFRPSFHYDTLQAPARTLGERLQRLRKKLVLRAALRNPHLTHLFCLDPYVVPHVAAMRTRVEPVALPDGIEAGPPDAAAAAAIRARAGVAPGRRVALLFGALAYRKGLFHILEAALHVPAEAQRRLCLFFAGPVEPAERERFVAAVRRVQRETALQVLVDDRFIPEGEAQAVVASADLMLLPYQHHLGSSGVLVRAAAAGRPVLGADYGVVGAHLRRHGLGQAVDATRPVALARALTAWIAEGRLPGFDADAARAFAAENTADRFAETILRGAGFGSALAPASVDPRTAAS